MIHFNLLVIADIDGIVRRIRLVIKHIDEYVKKSSTIRHKLALRNLGGKC